MLVPITMEVMADVADPKGIFERFADLLQEMSECIREGDHREEGMLELEGAEARWSVDWDFAEEG